MIRAVLKAKGSKLDDLKKKKKEKFSHALRAETAAIFQVPFKDIELHWESIDAENADNICIQIEFPVPIPTSVSKMRELEKVWETWVLQLIGFVQSYEGLPPGFYGVQFRPQWGEQYRYIQID